MVHVRLISDLHLEFYKKHSDVEQLLARIPGPETTDEILIIAGDFSTAFTAQGKPRPSLARYLAMLTARWGQQRVFLVSGNHEYYRTHSLRKAKSRRRPSGNSPKTLFSVPELHQETDFIVRQAAQDAGAVFLQCESYTLDELDVTIVGCTLWTETTEIAWQGMNDKIRVFPGGGMKMELERHKAHVDYLTNFLDEWRDQFPEVASSRLVIVTHHLPSEKMIPDEYVGSPMNPGYCSQLDYLIARYSDYIDLWCCGHTHVPKSIEIDGVPVVCSPIGYPKERDPHGKLSVVIELGGSPATRT